MFLLQKKSTQSSDQASPVSAAPAGAFRGQPPQAALRPRWEAAERSPKRAPEEAVRLSREKEPQRSERALGVRPRRGIRSLWRRMRVQRVSAAKCNDENIVAANAADLPSPTANAVPPLLKGECCQPLCAGCFCRCGPGFAPSGRSWRRRRLMRGNSRRSRHIMMIQYELRNFLFRQKHYHCGKIILHCTRYCANITTTANKKGPRKPEAFCR